MDIRITQLMHVCGEGDDKTVVDAQMRTYAALATPEIVWMLDGYACDYCPGCGERLPSSLDVVLEHMAEEA